MWQLHAAGRKQDASVHEHTFADPVRSRPERATAIVEKINQTLNQTQRQFDIIVGLGFTAAGQARKVYILASSDEIKQRLQSSPLWPCVQLDLQGLSQRTAEQAVLQGERP